MVGAIDEPHVISHSGRGRKKTSPEQKQESVARHGPLLGPSRPRALRKIIQPGDEDRQMVEGTGRSKAVLFEVTGRWLS